MARPDSAIDRTQRDSNYDLLRVYTYYRTLLGSILLLMFQGNLAPTILGNEQPDIFLYTAVGYTALNLITLGLLWRARFQPSDRQSFILLGIDVAALALMMFTSGGAMSGLGYLQLVVIAAAGMLLPSRLAILLAALASIAVIGESLARLWLLSINNQALFSAGTLGALLFVTALSFQYLAHKIRSSNEEALNQARQAEHLQRLAQLIVERMRTGILVLGKSQSIELSNRAAFDLLGSDFPRSEHGAQHLSSVPLLQHAYNQWRQQNHSGSIVAMDALTRNELKINFAPLTPQSDSEILVFVEDNRLITQQAQQLKLASLGRLTASIAHEVRNPLGAISHASQLLGESSELGSGDQRLLQIIDNHSRRVNQIIENVLQLSRRKNAHPEPLELGQWLARFLQEYHSTQPDRHNVTLTLGQPQIPAKFDHGQLHQVLTNLCDNGIRHSLAAGRADVWLEAGVEPRKQQPFIRVIDGGDGIAEEHARHIFEPFFTTESTGSGLGLYICKELCEANQALIHYECTDEGRSCFHIQLPHPDRAF
ncbi:sensor histidine kinase [Marinimicrobium sp. ARAG 43.8]|uniref:sensor histidine kinase n=1 Tax=Marinimicrobium sp. ARAG 43.8 TaxID=3418719 RepID=UPI003CE9797C